MIALVLVSPAQAAVAEKTLTLSYTCAGGPFSNTSLSVEIIVPDTGSGTFEVKWKLPALTLRTAPTATTQVKVAGKLLVTGGTHTDLDKTGASVSSGLTTVLAAQVTSTVAVTATTGQQVTVKGATEQGSLKLSLANATTDATTCTTTTAQSVTVTVGQGGGGGTQEDVVTYSCTTGTESSPQTVEIKVTLTMPTTAPKAGEQFTIGWAGVYETGSELEAPSTGLQTGNKIFANVSITGITGLTSATGSADLTAATDGNPITLPTRIDIRATANTAGTATIKPAAVNIGTSATSPTIKCEPQNATTLKTYTLTVGSGTGSSPSATPTPSKTPTPTPTPKPSSSKSSRNSTTPKAGVDTGGGGMAGPDGRLFVLVGSVLITAAGVGGLLMRRRPAARFKL
ncbi:hypothetical protein [Nonomuraea rhizosphaerae]|uniref:hypothetical protein n=1 Tax=Nonomuraea rhizosphaerae TaxID=2665663 RepID=UPI001C6079F8|nr:hypothetical protein [Nonomuraea rhizosphaerae]